MQLLRGCPRCHLNNALTLYLAPIFRYMYLSIFVWWHVVRGFHSSDCLSPPNPPPFASALWHVECWLCGIMAWGTESESEQRVCCLLVSTGILACFSPRRAQHGQHTTQKRQAVILFWQLVPVRPRPDCQCVCVCVCVRVFVLVYEYVCQSFPERLGEQNGQTPSILFFLAQGKVRHVSIHRL